MRAAVAGITVLLSAWTLPVAAGDEPPQLQRNPFSRPSSEVLLDDRLATRTDDDNPTLQLLATMIGSDRKLANVGGRILKPGDEINGYVLVAVYERYAVFERGRARTTVYVKPILEETPAGRRR